MITGINKFIILDDVIGLGEFIEKYDPEIPSEIYNICCKFLAINCFQYFYDKRSIERIKKDEKFKTIVVNAAKEGKNIDGNALWTNSHKRNARSPAPATLISSWDHSVHQSCFYDAFIAGILTNQKKKGLEFVKMLMMYSIPIDDQIYYMINDDDRIQGYVSMMHRYLYQDFFNTYAAAKKQQIKFSLKHQ